MAKKTSKNPLSEKYGKRMFKAHGEHKDDETNFGSFSDLPSGIRNGIARLIDCRIATYEKGNNEGEPYFIAQGVVVSPREHDGQVIEGNRTMIMEPLCDTPGRSREDFEQHLDWIYNELRKLGVDTAEIEASNIEELVEELQNQMDALKGDPDDPSTWTFFRFRTWQGKATPEFPDPRVNHNWMGACDWEMEDSADDDTEDDTEDAGSATKAKLSKPAAKNGKAKPDAKPTGKKASKVKPPEPEGEDEEAAGDEGEAFDEFGDLGTLAKKADKGDDRAGRALRGIAIKYGVPAKKIDSAKNWGAVVAMIEKARPETQEEEEEGEEDADEEGEEAAEETADEQEADDAGGADDDFEPQKEDVYLYKAPRSKKAVECEVTAVDKKKQTVSLKSIDDPSKVYKSVSWEELIRDTDDE